MGNEPVSAVTLASPYFLLSYPHTPYNGNGEGSDKDPDYWVEKFFRDLCRELEELDVASPVKVGVFDRDLWVGNDWLTGLPKALATCRTLVPLIEPRYFQSLACGKEWAAFADRRLRRTTPGVAPPIVPVMWKPMKPDELPAAARSVTINYGGRASYMEFGLESIMRGRYRPDYDEVVRQLAARVKQVAEVPAPPSSPVDYDELLSPFAAVGPMPGDHPLRITVVAPCLHDLPPGRGKLHYGPAARDWNPYLPEPVEPAAVSDEALADRPEPIADYISNFARSQGFRPWAGDLADHSRYLLNDGPPARPELLIVDPWALLRPECGQLLKRCRLSVKPWVQVAIPWNPDDQELVAAGDQLREVLEDALGPKLEQVRVIAPLAADGVPSLEGVRMILPELMLAAKKNYFRYAEVPLLGGPSLPGFSPDS